MFSIVVACVCWLMYSLIYAHTQGELRIGLIVQAQNFDGTFPICKQHRVPAAIGTSMSMMYTVIDNVYNCVLKHRVSI